MTAEELRSRLKIIPTVLVEDEAWAYLEEFRRSAAIQASDRLVVDETGAVLLTTDDGELHRWTLTSAPYLDAAYRALLPYGGSVTIEPSA